MLNLERQNYPEFFALSSEKKQRVVHDKFMVKLNAKLTNKAVFNAESQIPKQKVKTILKL